MRILNTTRGTELASDARVARGYWSRLIGLMGRGSMRPGEGLVLDPCTSVHTFFMRFAIDILYVDRSQNVVKVVSALRPFRISAVLRGGRAVIELPGGTAERTQTVPGDQLSYPE